jgi:hydrogenase nickel incorporation protein HypA/HybF
MHEFSISSEIVKTVLDTAEKNHGKKVLSVQLEIGELTLLNVEQIIFWVQELLKGSIAENANVKVKKIKVRVSCEDCGYRGAGKLKQEDTFSHSVLPHCPRCHSFQIKVEKGNECLLKRIQAVRY